MLSEFPPSTLGRKWCQAVSPESMAAHMGIAGEDRDGERIPSYKPGLCGSTLPTGKTNGVWGLDSLGAEIYLPHM